MTCHDVKELIPEILRFPGKYPEAEAHIDTCVTCREEMDFIRSMMGMAQDTAISGSPENVHKAINHKIAGRRIGFSTGIAAVLVIMLSFVFVLDRREDPYGYFASMDTETLEMMSYTDEEAGIQISADDIALYLIANDELQDLMNTTQER